MFFNKKISLSLILFYAVSIHPVENLVLEPTLQSFQLKRVVCPQDKEVAVQRKLSDARELKKVVVTSAVVVGVVVGLYLLYQASEAANAHDEKMAQERHKDMILAAIKEHNFVPGPKNSEPSHDVVQKSTSETSTTKNQTLPGWIGWAGSEIKSLGRGSAKFLANSAFMFTAGVVIKETADYIKNKIDQVYADETVLWFTSEQTKIPLLFNDLKTYSIDYDLYASLLSTQALNLESQLHLKAFVTEFLEAAQSGMQDDIFRDAGYLSYMLYEMKKKYIRKSGELEKLQEYVIPAQAKQHRALVKEHATILFASDMNRRADIALMCDTFVQDLQKLAAFIMLRGGLRYKARVQDMVDVSNKFLDKMEILLNSDAQALEQQSKANVGMFTSVYEYEKIFGEQINFLHRYCKLNY
jgi:hypothetical protein